MSAVSCFSEDEIYTPAFTHDFCRLIDAIAERMTGGEESAESAKLSEARALTLCLVLASQNYINFPPECIEHIQHILDVIEQRLDVVTDAAVRESPVYTEWRSLYLQMSQAICIMRIRDADTAQCAEMHDA